MKDCMLYSLKDWFYNCFICHKEHNNKCSTCTKKHKNNLNNTKDKKAKSLETCTHVTYVSNWHFLPLQELQELVIQEQSVILQTSNALNKCCMGDSQFAGSGEQVECNRLILVSCKL